MAIKTSDLNARLFAKADKRRATTTQEAQSAASEKAAVIELAVAGEHTVEFELVKVPASEIRDKTTVFDKNAREQSFLNELALSDILVTLKAHGQQYPAVGRWLDDGRIEVLDGSRRRMSCLIAEQDFLVYVAKGISTRHAKFLSDVANAHKPLSLYERGKEMQAMLDSGEVSDQKALASACQCSEALVSGALKAAALPLPLLQAYPSVSELGRPTIVKLHRLYFSLDASLQQKLVAKLGDTPLWQQVEAQGVTRITREVTQLIEQFKDELVEPTSSEREQTKTLLDGRASYRRKGNNLNISLRKVSDEDADRILALIKQALEN
ncbi:MULTISPECIES: ParB/RepB/Spo0J family partition protein [unclassified Salinivibrio]|uniref:ParB/RepB/Spo0J family partition protein n=1 Tax=unclassified Salinivibrio TaxID=2636825 RepID=UPI00128B3F51|nr:MULTISPECIES: ParB/RepB/Spo0J family partition protein [unclassified Salinivibrio]MPS30855.1 ParB/RepB/Spo0J family partition protein [Salinivibrio sp. VYel7]MPX89604.1 ParB/RepB/Spo0J family partition protein [Salinivibrio sp. VYel1]MPX92256.1 ParB/RepB/Spo0J family partition protein [Salinivibrio sp. VYel9]MPX97168.1 ParB/RepB/Spo0J family partition protein [Salinivibrio sp. VYel6]MPX98488.1 ParB/RepB/Spo0J family partition protein [Salinivibrio sp. VYel4]